MVLVRKQLSLISFIFCYSLIECAQPYFPPQIVFSPDNGQTVIAVDELNQRAYNTLVYGSSGRETSYVLQHFPYAIPDSPQSRFYVQLLIDSPPLGCMYGTYWKYGGNTFNSFPSHWLNGTSFQIGNYIQFKYEMIHSTDPTQSEDYWYATQTCQVDSGEAYPCEEIYFQKNTQIPLRFTQVIRRGWNMIQEITSYKIISMEKPSDQLFDSIPENWSLICRDVMLGLLYYPQSSKLNVTEQVTVQIWLITPPHRIDGNDTVIIEWKPNQCDDCLTWTPNRLSFNGKNFQERQKLTITRVKRGPTMTLSPVFYGGGFDLVPPQIYPIFIE